MSLAVFQPGIRGRTGTASIVAPAVKRDHTKPVGPRERLLRLQFSEHPLAEELVGAGLVTFAVLLEPLDDVGVEAEADGPLEGAVVVTADGVLPCRFGEAWGVGEVDLVVGKSSEGFQFLALLGR